MERRKILWYPSRGIDKTRFVGVDSYVDFCQAAVNVVAYDDGNIRSRASPKAVLTLPSAATTNLIQSIRVTGLDGNPKVYTLTTTGVYRDGVVVYEVSLPSTARMTVWKNRVYVAGGEDADETFVLVDPQTASPVAPGLLSIMLPPAYEVSILPFGDDPEYGYEYQATSMDGFTLDEITSLAKVGTEWVLTLSEPRPLWEAGMRAVFRRKRRTIANPAEFTSQIFCGDITVAVSTSIFKFAETGWEDEAVPTAYDYTLTPTTYEHWLMVHVGHVQVIARSRLTLLDTAPAYSNLPGDFLTFYYRIQYSNSVTGARSNTLLSSSIRFLAPAANPRLVKIPVDWTDADGFDEIRIFRMDPDTQSYRLIATLVVEDLAATYEELPYTYTDFDDEYNFDGTEETWLEDVGHAAVDPDGNPIGFSFITLYSNRIWGVWQNRVYFSEPVDIGPELGYFGPLGLNYFEFQENPILLLATTTSLLVFCPTGVWVLGGVNPYSMTQRLLMEYAGILSPDCAAAEAGNVFAMTPDGRVSLVSGQMQALMPKLNVLTRTNESWDYVLAVADNVLWITRS